MATSAKLTGGSSTLQQSLLLLEHIFFEHTLHQVAQFFRGELISFKVRGQFASAVDD